jgi:uncharacterized protein (DUF927 family)
VKSFPQKSGSKKTKGAKNNEVRKRILSEVTKLLQGLLV